VTVDRTEVARIAGLARLRLEADEVDRLTGDVNRILEYVDRLRGAADGRDRAEAAEPHAGEGARQDAPGGPDPLTSGPGTFAPSFEQGFFVVPPPPGVTAE
jgi:aspartyl/glutamyl-tRNA(Asn/Gln) amidotransferase C subunit